MKFNEYLKKDFHGAGIIYFTPDKKVLLLKKENGKWTFPGGHREPNEEPLQTAQRESFEELGVAPEGEMCGKIKIIKDEIQKTVYSFFKRVEEEFVPKLSFEHKDYIWLKYKDINPKLLTKVFQPYWNVYKKILKKF